MQLVGVGRGLALPERRSLAWARQLRLDAPPPSSGRRARWPRCARSRSRRTTSPTPPRRGRRARPRGHRPSCIGRSGGLLDDPGENTRVIAMAAAVDDALTGWEPAPDEVDVAVAAAAIIALNTMVGEIAGRPVVPGAAGEVRRPDAPTPRAKRAGRRAAPPRTLDDPSGTLERLARSTLAHGYDRAVRRDGAALVGPLPGERRRPRARPSRRPSRAWPWSSDDDGPWIRRDGALGRSAVSTPSSASARRRPSTRAPRSRSSTCSRRTTTRSRRAPCSPATRSPSGRFDEAERLIAEIERLTHRAHRASAAPSSPAPVRAELALARGDVDEGLRLYRVAGRRAGRAITLPGHGRAHRAGTLGAVRRGRRRRRRTPCTAPAATARDLFEALRAKVARGARTRTGRTWTTRSPAWSCYGLGAWGLLRDALPTRGRHPAAGAGRAVRLPAVHRPPWTRERTDDGGRARSRPAWPPGSGRSTATARARTSCAEARAVAERIAAVTDYILRL